MHLEWRSVASRLFLTSLCASLAVITSEAQVSVRSVKVSGSKETVEIEVEASDRITPQTQVLSGPDRLVVDFPNAVPGAQLRSQSVERGEVKDVRVGLFQSRPPVTRVVVDLNQARSYQVFPAGRTVMIKVTGNATEASSATNQSAPRAGLIAANYTTGSEPVAVVNAPEKALEVSFRNGLLGIVAHKATLSEVLYAIQQRTGADIAIPAGAEQERVVAEIEAAPAPDVLARLLNGSRFNFLIMSSPNDPRQLDRVILTPRAEGMLLPLPSPVQDAAQANNEDIPDEENAPPAPQQPGRVQGGQPVPGQNPEAKAVPDNAPEQ